METNLEGSLEGVNIKASAPSRHSEHAFIAKKRNATSLRIGCSPSKSQPRPRPPPKKKHASPRQMQFDQGPTST